ncbi:MAG: carbohydrate-binding domain-containing protein [Clostridia bacterium]|nr:carbohydrate-binding domain-containing protein [Clostridia bacterium]
MKKSIFTIISIFIFISIVLSGCKSTEAIGSVADNSQTVDLKNATESAEDESITNTITASESKSADELFSSRDLSGEVDTTGTVKITLNGNSATATSNNVNISGSTVTIKKNGTYILSGTLTNGSVIVNVSKEEKVQLVLNGVNITSDTFAPIYVAGADKVFITLSDGTKNTLANGGLFKQIDNNNVDAVIFSKDDITFNGTGTLTVKSPAGHSIVGKDEVTIANGTYNITSSKTAIRANDSIAIADGIFNLTAGTDGIHAENNDDDTLGSVYIKAGTFNIKVGDDGIHATTTLQIDGGTFNITAAEGLEATYVKINNGTIMISASDDGINAAKKSSSLTPKVEINGGNIAITMGQGDTDGVDSNGDIIINGGTISVTGNSTFDYDGNGVINGGKVIVNGSEVSTLPNQMMGGPGGGGPQGNGGFGGNGGLKGPRG